MLGLGAISSQPISGGARNFSTATDDQAHGGYIVNAPSGSGKRTKEERDELRRIFAGLPAKVAKTIKQVAKQEVDEPNETASDALVAALEAKNLQYREKYVQALRLEVARLRELQAQEQDDEETLLLLMM